MEGAGKKVRQLSKQQIARAVVDVCHRLAVRGFVAASDGNVSARLASGNILITRAGINKGQVRREDLVEVTPEGKKVRGRGSASTELGMHLFIYRRRPDVRAVVHAHPICATGFAAARISLDACVFPEVIVGIGAIPLARYATPSTGEVAHSIAPFVGNTDALLLANHGAVTFGRDTQEAFFRMEKVEYTAQVTLVARTLGGAVPLSRDELEKLRAISLTSYGISLDRSLPRKPQSR